MTEAEIWIEKLKIQERLAAYTHAMDGKDAAAWAACFTPDGMFGVGDYAIRGRDKLRAYAEIHASVSTRHLTTSPVYTIGADGRTARGRATTVATAATRHGYKIIFAGRYDDILEKLDGEWLLAERWAVAEGIPDDPAFDVATADPDVAAILKPWFGAFPTLGEKVR